MAKALSEWIKGLRLVVLRPCGARTECGPDWRGALRLSKAGALTASREHLTLDDQLLWLRPGDRLLPCGQMPQGLPQPAVDLLEWQGAGRA
jgi:hypothetical protein